MRFDALDECARRLMKRSHGLRGGIEKNVLILLQIGNLRRLDAVTIRSQHCKTLQLGAVTASREHRRDGRGVGMKRILIGILLLDLIHNKCLSIRRRNGL